MLVPVTPVLFVYSDNESGDEDELLYQLGQKESLGLDENTPKQGTPTKVKQSADTDIVTITTQPQISPPNSPDLAVFQENQPITPDTGRDKLESPEIVQFTSVSPDNDLGVVIKPQSDSEEIQADVTPQHPGDNDDSSTAIDIPHGEVETQEVVSGGQAVSDCQVVSDCQKISESPAVNGGQVISGSQEVSGGQEVSDSPVVSESPVVSNRATVSEGHVKFDEGTLDYERGGDRYVTVIKSFCQS